MAEGVGGPESNLPKRGGLNRFLPYNGVRVDTFTEYAVSLPESLSEVVQRLVDTAKNNAVVVSLDGVSGAGKSTAQSLLANKLEGLGKRVIKMKFGGFIDGDEMAAFGLEGPEFEEFRQEMGKLNESRNNSDPKAGEMSWQLLQELYVRRLLLVDPAGEKSIMIGQRGPINRLLSWHKSRDFESPFVAPIRFPTVSDEPFKVKIPKPDLVIGLISEREYTLNRLINEDKGAERLDRGERNREGFDQLAMRLALNDTNRVALIHSSNEIDKVVKLAMEVMRERNLIHP